MSAHGRSKHTTRKPFKENSIPREVLSGPGSCASEQPRQCCTDPGQLRMKWLTRPEEFPSASPVTCASPDCASLAHQPGYQSSRPREYDDIWPGGLRQHSSKELVQVSTAVHSWRAKGPNSTLGSSQNACCDKNDSNGEDSVPLQADCPCQTGNWIDLSHKLKGELGALAETQSGLASSRKIVPAGALRDSATSFATGLHGPAVRLSEACPRAALYDNPASAELDAACPQLEPAATHVQLLATRPTACLPGEATAIEQAPNSASIIGACKAGHPIQCELVRVYYSTHLTR